MLAIQHSTLQGIDLERGTTGIEEVDKGNRIDRRVQVGFTMLYIERIQCRDDSIFQSILRYHVFQGLIVEGP